VAGDPTAGVGPVPGGEYPPEPVRRRVVRRCLDIALGGLALVVLSLPMLVIALLVRAGSPGPALFRQTRLGQHGRRFRMLKFRTMAAGCDDEAHRDFVTRLLRDEDPRSDPGGLYKLATDPRITHLGRLLRRSSLDELPQLINVLRGEMSLVGPRPMLPWEAELLGPDDQERFAVPAGITGLWQVSGRSALTMAQALELDARYARTTGFLLDVGILARTVWTVLVPHGRAR
jgi:lipopolysaccharide/colanic/teichoic acid biosynthesis glycosyltransferase